jgi:hypothetical protein
MFHCKIQIRKFKLPIDSHSKEGAVIFTCNNGFVVNSGFVVNRDSERDQCTPCESSYKMNAVNGKPFYEMSKYLVFQ